MLKKRDIKNGTGNQSRSGPKNLMISGIKIRWSFLIPPFLGFFTSGMFLMSIGVMLPDMQKSFALTETQIGTLLSFLMLASLIAMNVTLILSANLPRKIPLLVGLILNSLGLLLLGMANSYYVMLGTVCLCGSGGGILSLSLYSLMAEILPRSRGLLVGLTNGLFACVGGFLGPFLSGILTSRFGWRTPVLVFSCISFIAVAFFVFLQEGSSFVVRNKSEFRKAYSEVLRSKTILVVSASIFAANFGYRAFSLWAPSFLLATGKFDLVQTGTLFGGWALLGGVGAIFLGWRSDRWDRRLVTIAAGFTSAAVLFIFFVLPIGESMLILLLLVLGFASGAFWNLMISLAQDEVDPIAIVFVTSLMQTAGVAAGVFSPIVSAELIQGMGLREALLVSVLTPYVIHTMLLLFAKRKMKSRITLTRVSH